LVWALFLKAESFFFSAQAVPCEKVKPLRGDESNTSTYGSVCARQPPASFKNPDYAKKLASKE
jgi:hypothetical protein